MKKLKFIFDEEEEEEEKFGWEQRTRGIGELPELEIPKSTKLKFTADIGLGVGAKAVGGITLPEAEEHAEVGVTQRMRGIGEPPEKYPFEGITTELKEASSKLNSLWWSELQTTEDKWKFLKHENWSPKLQQADLQVQRLSEQASKMGVNTGDWIEYGVYATFFAAMAAQVLPLVSGLPKNILNNLTYKVEGKIVKGQELKNILRRVAYPEAGKPSIFDRKVFDEFTKRGGIKGIGGSLKKGITITEIKPRFAFGAKLYGGLPADAIVKSLVETGKIGAEISKELSVSTPEKVSQVIQNLNITSPAIASKLASELNELKPQKTFVGKAYRAETFIPEHGADVIAKMKTAQEKLDYDASTTGNPIFREVGKLTGRAGIDLGKVPVKEMVWVAKDLKTAQKYGDAKEIPIPEDTIILMEDDEGGSLILKNADKYREPVTVGLEEEAKVEALWAGKLEEPAEIPKVGVKEPEILEAINAVKRLGKAQSRLDRNKIIREAEKLSGGDRMKGMKLEEELTTKARQDKIEAQNNLYNALEPKHKIGDIVEIKLEGVMKKRKIKIEGAMFDVGLSMQQAIKTGFPASFKLENLYGTDIVTGEKNVPIYPNFFVEGKPLEDTIRIKSEDVLQEFLKVEPIPPPKPELPAEKVVPPVEKVKVEPTPKVEPKPDVATPAQIKKAHAIANSKAMISEKGKMKPQYRRLAEAMTGEKSIKKMTPEKAEIFIDALERLPEPKLQKGKLVPPTIPRTTRLVIQDFFKRKYREPTPFRYLTPQTYYAEMLGVKPLVEPYEIGKQKFDLEFRKTSKTADQIIAKLNKIAKTPLGEKLKSVVKNIPTKAESNMAELVNRYEEAPAKLEQGLKDVFNWHRSLSRDLINRENEVREKVDLPPIKYKKAYFKHTADGMAKEMLEGKYPFPQGLKYWAEKMVGKKIFNPMEFRRKLSDDLVDLWSKDLRAVTNSMLWHGLKEIHLAQPAKFLSEQLSAISKDLPIYRNLSPEEKTAYDETRAMPASTKKWLIDYVNQVMKGQETELDASLNRIVTQTGLKGLFNKVLSPFGRSLGRKPITKTFQFGGRVVISGVMGWVPRQIIRNVFQQTQNLALYGVKATVKSFLPASVDKNLKGLLSESLFLKSYTGFEELPTNLMGKLEKIWLGPYGIVATWNAAQGMKAAYWSALNLIKNPKYFGTEFSMANPSRTKDTPRDYLFPSEKEKLLKEMEYGSGATQYQYIPMGMPEVFRHKALVPLTRLQSWWMNYFTKFTREAIHRGIKGETGYGQKLPWSYRVNYLKYVIIGGAILTALGYRRSFMIGVLPGYLSPAGQVAIGFYNYATADYDWQRKRALQQIKKSWTAFIPGSLAWKDFMAVWNGDKDLKDLFFYKKIEKEEKKKVPLKITVPKKGKLKFTGPKLDIKSTKLKFNF